MLELLIGERRKDNDKNGKWKNPNLLSLCRYEEVASGRFRDEAILFFFFFLGTVKVYSVCLYQTRLLGLPAHRALCALHSVPISSWLSTNKVVCVPNKLEQETRVRWFSLWFFLSPSGYGILTFSNQGHVSPSLSLFVCIGTFLKLLALSSSVLN